jgi:hypothetical protein
MIYDQIDISERRESVKIDSLHSTLIRKGLITETEDKITTVGKELLTFIESKDTKKFVKRKTGITEFKKWWQAFPGTSTFTYKGRHFEGSRSLRVKEEECRIKFDKILSDGLFTTDDLIKALEYEIRQKMEYSLKTRENKLQYMHNSLTYLNQRDFEPYVELIKSGDIITESSTENSAVVDI